MPLVTVVIPAYQAEAFLSATVESVRAQSLQDWELFVVDDGSSDGTYPIACDLAATEVRMQVIQQPNRGVSTARNAGLERASGGFVAFLDADDIWEPDFLETAIDSLRSSGADAFVGQAKRFVSEPGDRMEAYGPEEGYRRRLPRSLLDGIPFAPCMGVVKTGLARELGGFRDGDHYWEDWDFWIRLGEAGATIEIWQGRALVHYRMTADSRSSDAVRCFTKSIRTLEQHWDSPLAPLWVKRRSKARFFRFCGKNSTKLGSRASYFVQALTWYPFDLKNWLIWLRLFGRPPERGIHP